MIEKKTLFHTRLMHLKNSHIRLSLMVTTKILRPNHLLKKIKFVFDCTGDMTEYWCNAPSRYPCRIIDNKPRLAGFKVFQMSLYIAAIKGTSSAKHEWIILIFWPVFNVSSHK